MSKKFWNFILQQPESGEAVLSIDGEIAETSWYSDAITAAQFTKELKELGDVNNIVVRINSGGGDVFAANAIYTRLKEHKATINVKIDGWCASAATIIAMAGDTIEIPASAVFMIHNPKMSVFNYCEAKEFEKFAKELDTIKNSIVNAYCTRTGKSKEEVSKLMDEESWWTGEEAVENGFCDKLMFSNVENIVDNHKAIINKVSMDYEKLPAKIQKLFKVENKIENQVPNKESITNVNQLRNTYPELVKMIEDEAVSNERKRISDIEDVTMIGYEEMAKEAKFTKPIEAKDLSMKIIAEEKKKGKNYIDDRNADVVESNVNRCGSAPTPQVKDKWDIAIDTVLPRKGEK